MTNQKPIPTSSVDSAPYWQAAAANTLVMQRCTQCQRLQNPPRRYCAACQSDSLQWQTMRGRGKVASFSHVARGPTAAFKEPYTLALIDMEEGVRMMLNLCGDDRETVTIGDAVEIFFEARGEAGVKLPQARLIADVIAGIAATSATPATPVAPARHRSHNAES